MILSRCERFTLLQKLYEKAHKNISRYEKPIILKNLFCEKDFTDFYRKDYSLTAQRMSKISIEGNYINIILL